MLLGITPLCWALIGSLQLACLKKSSRFGNYELYCFCCTVSWILAGGTYLFTLLLMKQKELLLYANRRASGRKIVNSASGALQTAEE